MKGEGIVRYSKRSDDFSRAKYEHMMGGSGLILGFCRFYKLQLSPRTTRAVLELARAAPP